jgi:hypothetical protein
MKTLASDVHNLGKTAITKLKITQQWMLVRGSWIIALRDTVIEVVTLRGDVSRPRRCEDERRGKGAVVARCNVLAQGARFIAPFIRPH